MSPFLHLYLGHLFGDYVLQSGWIASRKAKERKILVLHAFLVTVSHVVFILGRNLRPYHIIWILALGGVHYSIDLFKTLKGNSGWRWYLLDQAIHFATIVLFAPLFSGVDFLLPDWITIRAILSVFNAYLIGILFHSVFNSGGVYRRDIVGYLFRAALPWVPGIWPTVALGILGIFTTWKIHGRRDSVVSTALSSVITLLWEVVA